MPVNRVGADVRKPQRALTHSRVAEGPVGPFERSANRKAAQRSVAQSLARQLGPENIHVAYVVLDGVVDLAATGARMADKPAGFFLAATGVAEAAYTLAPQDRQAWTFELDLRPFGETW